MEFFHVDFCHVDTNGFATIPNIINYLQETAWQHANKINIGYHTMLKENLAFVINRMLLKTRRLPVWNEMISVETWILPHDHVKAVREFTIRDNFRNLIAAATISYIIIDLKTRRIRKIPDTITNCFDNDELFDESISKLVLNDNKTLIGLHTVKPSDLDMNKHVNNSKYSQWILDYLPASWRVNYPPCSIQINFHNEMGIDNQVAIYIEENNKRLMVEGIEIKCKKAIFTASLCFKSKLEKPI